MLTFSIIILSAILAVCIPLYPELTLSILKGELIIYIVLVLINILKTRRLTLFSTWIVAFVFIIWSDMTLTAYNYDNSTFATPIFFYLIGNACVLLGYVAYSRNSVKTINSNIVVTHPNYLLLFIIFSIVLYIYLQKDIILETLLFGRVLSDVKGAGSILVIITDGIGLLMPAVIAYYFVHVKRKSAIFAIVLALPMFIAQFIMATRFKLLFQLLPFLFITKIIKLKDITIKSTIVLLLCAGALSVTSSFMKENRNMSYLYYTADNSEYANDTYSDPYVALASNMSPEGIIHMAHLANRYFDNNPLMYGKETSFLLYFWVPRSIWENKPFPIDHWLIRKYENVADEHSTASGFLGELRADFGWFALIFAFFIGMIIKRCDNYVNYITSLKNTPFQITIATMLYPYFFFFVRSPITSTISISFAFLLYFIIKYCFCSTIRTKDDTTSN